MAKHTYFAPEFPNVTRTTERTYTHVIIDERGEPLTWAGNPKLASNQVSIWSKRGCKGVRMVPVQIKEKSKK